MCILKIAYVHVHFTGYISICMHVFVQKIGINWAMLLLKKFAPDGVSQVPATYLKLYALCFQLSVTQCCQLCKKIVSKYIWHDLTNLALSLLLILFTLVNCSVTVCRKFLYSSVRILDGYIDVIIVYNLTSSFSLAYSSWFSWWWHSSCQHLLMAPEWEARCAWFAVWGGGEGGGGGGGQL